MSFSLTHKQSNNLTVSSYIAPFDVYFNNICLSSVLTIIHLSANGTCDESFLRDLKLFLLFIRRFPGLYDSLLKYSCICTYLYVLPCTKHLVCILRTLTMYFYIHVWTCNFFYSYICSTHFQCFCAYQYVLARTRSFLVFIIYHHPGFHSFVFYSYVSTRFRALATLEVEMNDLNK